MKKKLALVLSGGGARGALQVGALRALFEAGYQPDMVTGTSIGAANGAFLVIHGYTLVGIQRLEEVWKSTVDQNLLPTNLWYQTMRAFFRRTRGFSQDRIREFAIINGLTPDLRFKDLQDVELYPVAADLNAGRPVIFGLDPEGSVLEGVLASMSLPPWLAPREVEGRYLIDGGAVSNLPIEAALQMGATEIVALDLSDPNQSTTSSNALGGFLAKLDKTVENREGQLELQLAEARGVPVRHILLTSEPPVPLWDFRQSPQLIERGYQLANQAIASWPPENRPSWWRKIHIPNLLEGFFKSLE
jgi:NTE family protein